MWCPHPACFLETECHVLLRQCPIEAHHGRSSKGAASVLMTRCGGAPQPSKCHACNSDKSIFDSGQLCHINIRTTHLTKHFTPRQKKKNTEAATQTAQQVDDANSSQHFVKGHLWQQQAHALDNDCSHVKNSCLQRCLQVRWRRHSPLHFCATTTW